MRTTCILTAVLLLAACKVEKTGPDTYKVVTPSVTTSKSKTTTTGTTLKQEAKDAGKKIEKGAGNVAEKAGTALQKLGEKAKQKAAGH
jgi:hypothetical protein